VRPFGDHHLLHCLDLFALAAVWMTLWSGSVFNDHPRCEDGVGDTLAWCNVLSVVVGVLIIFCLVLVLAVIVYYKKKARAAAALLLASQPQVAAVDTDDAIEELAIEMTEQDMLSFDFDVKTMESNPMRKMEEEEEEAAAAEESSSSSGGGGAVASQQGTINPVMEENVLDILYDAAGRRYSHNKSTGETKWIDDEEEVVVKEEEEEEIEVLTDEATGGKYFINRVTGESEWL
jgi:hypothetical protein